MALTQSGEFKWGAMMVNVIEHALSSNDFDYQASSDAIPKMVA